MNTDRNSKMEEILGSIDNMQKAAAPDFFYTRLKARMEKEAGTGVQKHWVLRPLYAFAALLLVLAINAAVILKGNESSDNTTPSDSEVMQSIASEYSINSNLTYEINQ